jgi:hypothetical protein
VKQKPCDHQFEEWATVPSENGIHEVIETCSCGVERRRKPTEEEVSKFLSEQKLIDDLHKVYHEFEGVLGDSIGFEAMEKAEKFAKEYPDSVRIVSVDDSYHSSSFLVLIDHMNKKKYWGTSVVFISQCAGRKPVEFFLYPEHLIDLKEALGEIQSKVLSNGLSNPFWDSVGESTSDD